MILKSVENIKEIRYIQGQPEIVRFNANSGDVVFRGQVLDLSCIAYIGVRFFEGQPFPQYSHGLWAELYAVTDTGSVACISFHGASAANLMEVFEYQEPQIGSKIGIRIEKRTNRKIGVIYYVACFSVVEHAMNTPVWAANLSLFRTQTQGCQPIGTQKILLSN